MAEQVDELDPLFFRGGIPGVEKAFVKGADDLVERRFLAAAVMVAADVRVLRVEFGFGEVELDVLVQLYPLKAVGGEVDAFEELVDLFLILLGDLELGDE